MGMREEEKICKFFASFFVYFYFFYLKIRFLGFFLVKSPKNTDSFLGGEGKKKEEEDGGLLLLYSFYYLVASLFNFLLFLKLFVKKKLHFDVSPPGVEVAVP